MTGPKAFKTLQARCALAGFSLLRSHPADGPPRYFLCYREQVRELRSIDDAEALVVALASSEG